jgi:hypothetical protein
MSKAKHLAMALSLVLSSSALAAGVAQGGDVTMHLEGAALLANGFYSAQPHGRLVLNVEMERGKLLMVYAAAGTPDGQIEPGTIVLVHSAIVVSGQAKFVLETPTAPAGAIILVGCLVVDEKSAKASDPIGIQIAGTEVLYAPASTEASADGHEEAKPPLTLEE